MSILRMASFKASYALFLKLVSGTIRTIAISASAMVGAALVGLRIGMTDLRTIDLLRGRRPLPEEYPQIFGIPHARMSSYPYFQHFDPSRCLDNSASGIPNAIARQSNGGWNRPPQTRVRVLRSRENRLRAREGSTAQKPARVADDLRN